MGCKSKVDEAALSRLFEGAQMRAKAITVAACFMFAATMLTGCNTDAGWKPPPPLPPEHNKPYQLSAKDLQIIQSTVSYPLKDPGSAQFRGIQAVTKQDGTIFVCGEVNGKNSFGGYTGFEPFTGMLSSGRFQINIVPAESGDIQAFAISSCRTSGMTL